MRLFPAAMTFISGFINIPNFFCTHFFYCEVIFIFAECKDTQVAEVMECAYKMVCKLVNCGNII